MPETDNFNNEFWMLITVFAVPIFLRLLVGFCIFINNFFRDLKYINCKIKRNTGAERRHWIRQRRRLWLSLIPFLKKGKY